MDSSKTNRGYDWIRPYLKQHHNDDLSKLTIATLDLAIAEWTTHSENGTKRQWGDKRGRPLAPVLAYVLEPARALLKRHDENNENISAKTKFDA